MQEKWGAVIAAAWLISAPCQSQVQVGVVYQVPRTYISVASRCPTDASPAELQFQFANARWGKPSEQGDREDMYICTIRAALRGFTPAQTRLAELYIVNLEGRVGKLHAPMAYDPTAALYWLRKAAAIGDGHAAYLAGQLYELGSGVDQDDDKAAAYYEMARVHGEAHAHEALENLKTRASRIERFNAEHEKRAAQGDARSMAAYAEAYLNGAPFKSDLHAAADWAQKAANAGDPAAMSLLAELKLRGAGTEQDATGAIDLLLRAAKGGNHKRDYYLVWLHDAPETTDAQARAIEDASAHGLLRDSLAWTASLSKITPGSRITGGLMTLDMSHTPLKDLLRRAKAGDTDAQVNLGLRYLDGLGAPQDRPAAKAAFEMAAHENSDANMNLGDMAYGDSLPNLKAAADYYATAAVMDDRLGAQNALGLYEKLQQPVSAYAMALMFESIGGARPLDGADALKQQLSIEDQARALQYLCELRLRHYRWFKW